VRNTRLAPRPLVYWPKAPLAISADIAPLAAGKKRRFCPLRILAHWPKSPLAISADIAPLAAGKKRRFCPLRINSGLLDL
jgi:hypothetical protein